MLRAAALPALKEVVTWAERLVSGCRDLISVVLPLTAAEREFIERLNDRGEITALGLVPALEGCSSGRAAGERACLPRRSRITAAGRRDWQKDSKQATIAAS